MATVYKNKNQNVSKTATVEKEVNEIRTAMEEKAKTGDKEAGKLLKKFDAAKEKGEEDGRQKAIKLIQDAINHDPSNFILSLFKDLEPDSSYSSLDAIYHELQQLINKSDLGRSLDRKVELARLLGAKNISEQEQTFIEKIKQAINNGNVKNVVAWMTMTELLNKHVLESAGEEGSVRPDKAKEILQNALNKLNASKEQNPSSQPKEQTPNEAQGNNQEQIQKQTQGSEEKKEEKKEEKGEGSEGNKGIKGLAEGAAVSKLLEEMSEREKSIKEFITGIKTAEDTKSLQKANAAILQFSAESQAILNKVDLSSEGIKQLQALQNDLNKAVEEKAKQLKVGTKPLTISDKHLKATEEHIENLMKKEETEYEEVITKYHNQVIEIFAEVFNIPKESIDKIIDETLDERIKRHTALGEVLRKISNEESQNLNLPPPEGFNINSLNQNK